VQDITALNDETVSSQIASDALNRITAVGDRILHVKALDGQFQLDKNENTGDIFIKPTQATSTAPIHVFITTEKQQTFSLLLLPTSINAQTIRLISEQSQVKTASWDTQASYQQTLIRLIKAMRRGEKLDGYQIDELAELPLDEKKTGVQLRLLTRYTSNTLQGEVYELANYTHESFTIDESTLFNDFYQDGHSLAVATNSHIVPPATFTQIYRVISHE